MVFDVRPCASPASLKTDQLGKASKLKAFLNILPWLRLESLSEILEKLVEFRSQNRPVALCIFVARISARKTVKNTSPVGF